MSTTTDVKDISEIIKNIVELLAVLVGGGWTIYKFDLFRERYPSIEIANSIKLVGENSEDYLLELSCEVENKGKSRKWLAPLEFSFLYLNKQDKFISAKNLNDQVGFRVYLHDSEINKEKKYWVNPDWHIPFVDGEVKKSFHYQISINKSDVAFLSLFTTFIDFNSKEKAVEHILNRTNTRMPGAEWDKLSSEERMNYNLKNHSGSDYYYAQVTTSIDELKNPKKENKA
jgi:hypothetical protein